MASKSREKEAMPSLTAGPAVDSSSVNTSLNSPLNTSSPLKRDALAPDVKDQLAKASLPMAGVGAVLCFAAFTSPGLLVGALLVGLEVILGSTSVYFLWPKNDKKRNHRKAA